MSCSGSGAGRCQKLKFILNGAALAYGYKEVAVRFIPTGQEIAQAEIVADWLLWLGNNGGGVRRLVFRL